MAPALKLDDPPAPAPKGVAPDAAGVQPAATLKSTAIALDTVCADPGELGDGNNTPPTADPISVSTTHYFCSPADEDWFKFDVSQNVTYKLDTYLVSANNDPLLEVYSDQGQTLVRRWHLRLGRLPRGPGLHGGQYWHLLCAGATVTVGIQRRRRCVLQLQPATHEPDEPVCRQRAGQ